VKVGDLISFKPIGFGIEDWSNPTIVLKQYDAPNSGLWVVWVDNMHCVVDDKNYEVVYLTSS
jgi:hypothetical protein